MSVQVQSQSYHQGKLRQDFIVTNHSDVKTINYTMYLPSDYEASSLRKFPVVYFLAGSFDQNDWIKHGEVNKIFDQLIDERRIPPFVGVMLCGAAYGAGDWNTFFKNYVLKSVETRASIDTARRAIIGFSLGGYYSLRTVCDLNNRFLSAVAICPLDKGSDSFFSDLTKVHQVSVSRGDKFKVFLCKMSTPLSRIQTDKPIMIITGDRDFALKEFSDIQNHFITNHQTEIRILDGAHSWSFAISNLEMALNFMGKHLFMNGQ